MKLRLLFLVLLLPFTSPADETWSGASNVYFKGYSNLHDFEGSIDKVPLKVTVAPGKDGRLVSAVTDVPVKQMSTHHEERDQNMMEMFQETAFRQIKVEVNRVPERGLRPKGAKPGTIPVTLTIAGTRSVVDARVSSLTESAGSAAFDLKFQVSLKAFKLKAPGALAGLVRVKDTVDVVAHITLKKEGAP